MEDKPSTSMEVNEPGSLPAKVNEAVWTKSLKNMPSITYGEIENYLILDKDKLPDHKPAEALKHKKGGYRLFKAGYTSNIWVKSNIKKEGNNVYFLVRCKVNAEMKKKTYTVYVHINQITSKIEYANCECPAGAGGRCKHVAAILFQLLDYTELDLNEVPDDKTCTQQLQQWHVPKKSDSKGPVLFEDLIFPQDTYEKDQKGRKRPLVQGKRDSYISTTEKVMKHDLEKLKSGLEVCSNCPLVGLLADNDCMPSDYDVNKLPSRQSLLELKGTKCNLETTAVRDAIVSKLTESTDFSLVPGKQCKTFVANKFNIDHDACLEIEKNTRAQSNCAEWHSERKSRLTASLFGHVMNRRKNIYPKSIVNKIVQSSHTTSTSCKWGTDNEQNALLKYYESMQSNDKLIEVCYSCGLIVNPKWPWLGASPDALIRDDSEEQVYGAVEVKCPSSKADLTILEACEDKTFYLKLVDNKPSLKKTHVYYFQCQGVMAICQLSYLDFVVFTQKDLHVERIYFDEQDWKSNMLPQLTSFYFDYLMQLV